MNRENGIGFQPDLQETKSAEYIYTKREQKRTLGSKFSVGKKYIAEKAGIELKNVIDNRDRAFLDRETHTAAVGDGTSEDGSDIAVDLFIQEVEKVNKIFADGESSDADTLHIIYEGLHRADSAIREYQKQHPDCALMGTTGVLAHLKQNAAGAWEAYVGQSGDSGAAVINRLDGTIRIINKGGSANMLAKAKILLNKEMGDNVPEHIKSAEDIADMAIGLESKVEELNTQLSKYEKWDEVPEDLKILYKDQTVVESLGGIHSTRPIIHTYKIPLKPGDALFLLTDGYLNDLSERQAKKIIQQNKDQSIQKIGTELREQVIQNIKLKKENPGIYVYKGIDDTTFSALEPIYEKMKRIEAEDNKDQLEDGFDTEGKTKGKIGEIEGLQKPEQQEEFIAQATNTIIEQTIQSAEPEGVNNTETTSAIQEKIKGNILLNSLKENLAGLSGSKIASLTRKAVDSAKKASLLKNVTGKIGALGSRLFAESAEQNQEGLKKEAEIQNGSYWETKIDTWATNFESWRELKSAELIQKLVSSRSSSARLEQEQQKTKEKDWSLDAILERLDKIQESVDLTNLIQKESIEKKSGIEKLEALCNQFKTNQLEEMKKYSREAAQVFNKLDQRAKTGLLSFKKVAKSFAAAAAIVGLVGFATYEGSQHWQKQHKAPEVVSFEQTVTPQENTTRAETTTPDIQTKDTAEKTYIDRASLKKVPVEGSPWNTAKKFFTQHGITDANELNTLIHKAAFDNKIDFSGETRHAGFRLDKDIQTTDTMDLTKAAESLGLIATESPEKTTQEISKNNTKNKISGLFALATTPLSKWFKA